MFYLSKANQILLCVYVQYLYQVYHVLLILKFLFSLWTATFNVDSLDKVPSMICISFPFHRHKICSNYYLFEVLASRLLNFHINDVICAIIILPLYKQWECRRADIPSFIILTPCRIGKSLQSIWSLGAYRLYLRALWFANELQWLDLTH